jgi:hypothetical protein
MDQLIGVNRFASHYSQAVLGSERGDRVGKPIAALAHGYLRDGYPARAGMNSAQPEVRSAGLDLGPGDHQQACALPVTGSGARRHTADMVS